MGEDATLKGYMVVDPATVMSTHLTEILRANISELLSYADVQKLLQELPDGQSKLVEDIVPGQITISGIQRVMQTLLAERVSVRDLSTILEGIAEAVGPMARKSSTEMPPARSPMKAPRWPIESFRNPGRSTTRTPTSGWRR